MDVDRMAMPSGGPISGSIPKRRITYRRTPSLNVKWRQAAFFTLAKREPLGIVHKIHQNSRLVIPEDSIIGSGRSIIRDGLTNTSRRRLVPALPEIEEGVVNGMFGKEVRMSAVGSSIRELSRLRRVDGPGRWRKRKGIAQLRLEDGSISRAEVRWYEAHGIGRVEIKIKRFLDD